MILTYVQSREQNHLELSLQRSTLRNNSGYFFILRDDCYQSRLGYVNVFNSGFINESISRCLKRLLNARSRLLASMKSFPLIRPWQKYNIPVPLCRTHISIGMDSFPAAVSLCISIMTGFRQVHKSIKALNRTAIYNVYLTHIHGIASGCTADVFKIFGVTIIQPSIIRFRS